MLYFELVLDSQKRKTNEDLIWGPVGLSGGEGWRLGKISWEKMSFDQEFKGHWDGWGKGTLSGQSMGENRRTRSRMFLLDVLIGWQFRHWRMSAGTGKLSWIRITPNMKESGNKPNGLDNSRGCGRQWVLRADSKEDKPGHGSPNK